MTGLAASVPGAVQRPADGWGARQVSVLYGKALALDRVSLLVPAGQVTAIVGGDGAGKSTLLRCLGGALAPSSGQVRTPGATRIGYLPTGSGTYPDLTVAENLAFRAAAYGLPPTVARERAAELMTQAGLAVARDRLAGQLSGGMRQKLGVIAALLHQPDLLILDEPTTGVDPVSRSGLWRLIGGAVAAGAAVVLATTYLDDAQRASAVLVLDGGRRLAAGTPDEIVAALPGTIVAVTGRPTGAEEPRSWRRGGGWRVWIPPGSPPQAGDPVSPDLQDAVTVAALAREAGLGPAGPVAAGPGEPRAGESEPASTGPASTGPASTGPASTGPASTGPAGPREPGSARAEPLAECAAVTRRFGRVTAVREVSLRVEAGEIVGLLGANGAGKTTLIRMLLGLLPVSAGRVALFGQPPSRGTRRRIGYVPQGLGLYDDLTVAENVSFSTRVFNGRPAALPVQLRPYAAIPVGRLPLGLQRRVAFAQALAHHPGLVILDEPTSGVDPLGRARLWDTVRSAAEAGAGALVTTHYMEEAQECDRLVIMADGGVVAAGTPAEVIADATVTVVEAPAWRAAFGRLEDSGFSVALAGHALRLPEADPAAVRQALAGAGWPGDAGPGGLDGAGGLAGARVYVAPATLEERFFQLAASGAGAGERP
jgi:ABC-2 type transport system ATP-binding protein